MFPPYNSTLVVRDDVLAKAGPDLDEGGRPGQQGPDRRGDAGAERPRRPRQEDPRARSPASTCPSRAGPVDRSVHAPVRRARLVSADVEPIEPLRCEDGALLVLDQRAAARARSAGCAARRPSEVADCIRTLAVRGAPAIGIAAAYGMALRRRPRRPAARSCCAPTRPDGGQPRLGARAGAGGGRPARAAPASCIASRTRADRRLAELGAALFAPGDRALTHCNAGALATGRLRHRRRRAARRLGARPAGAGLGRRDAPAAPGRAPDRLGAAPGRASPTA